MRRRPHLAPLPCRCPPTSTTYCCAGKGVHVVTVNDYLARRDSEWVGQVHKFLGLEVGLVQTVRWRGVLRCAAVQCV